MVSMCLPWGVRVADRWSMPAAGPSMPGAVSRHQVDLTTNCPQVKLPE